MKNQADRNDFLKLADFVIDNSGSLEEARLQIRRILKKTGYDNGLEEE